MPNRFIIGYWTPTDPDSLPLCDKNSGCLRDSMQLSDLRIYPNPATSICTIFASDIGDGNTATLFNLSGQEVAALGAVKYGTLDFNVSCFAAGIYMVRVKDEQGHSVVRKLVVQ